MTNKLKIVLALALAVGGLFGQTKPPVSTFTDNRDGQVYRIVRIGSQVWMAENLNYAAKGSKCYDNKPANCDTYGRLYDFETAKRACPVGWRLPSDKDWQTLVDFAGGVSIAGKKLKSTNCWNGNNGTDEYGFSALPGGNCQDYIHCNHAGNYGYWLSATSVNNVFIGSLWMNYNNDSIGIGSSLILHAFSIRCVQDDVKGNGNDN